MDRRLISILLIFFVVGGSAAAGTESEIPAGIRETKPVVRIHPKTGQPYVSIVATAEPRPDPLAGLRGNSSRPDYRLLDPRFKSGEIPYDGPVSDRRKVYLFATALMTVGTVGGAVGIAAAPASTGAATGGAGYLAAGSAVAGSASVAAAISQRTPPDEEFKEISESKTFEPTQEHPEND